jgi:hypothetical protein
MLRAPIGLVTILVASSAIVLAASTAAAREDGRVFYLTVHPRQCLIGTVTKTTKTVTVVSCANAGHKMEVYAVGHGGWGHRPPPSSAFSLARSVCLAAFQRLTGHALGRGFGWWAFWPDPGSETARYGDKIICSLRTWPQFAPLGSGWHVK